MPFLKTSFIRVVDTRSFLTLIFVFVGTSAINDNFIANTHLSTVVPRNKKKFKPNDENNFFEMGLEHLKF